MLQIFKKSTAGQLALVALVDATDGYTPETGILAPTITISKAGGALAAPNDGTWAELATGLYTVQLNATDTNTVGALVVNVVKAGCRNFVGMYAVTTLGLDQVDVGAISTDTTAADNCELMFDGTGYAGGGTKLGVDAVAISGDTTAADNCELMFDGTGYVGGTAKLGVDAVAISGDTTAANNLELDYDGTGYAKANSTIGTCTANTDMRGTDNAALASVLGAAVGVSISADIAAVKSDTGAILTDTGTTLDALIQDIPTTAEFNARTLVAADYVVTTDTIAGVTLATTCTTNTDMRGTDNAALASVLGAAVGASISADIAAVKGDTAAILTDTGTTLDALIQDIPTTAEFNARTLAAADYTVVTDTIAGATTVGSVTGSVGSVVGAVGSVTGNVGGSVASVTGAVGSVTGAVGSVTGNVGGNVGGNITGSIGSLATQAKADVEAEVADALNAAVPGSPTAGSINERVKAIDDKLPSATYLRGTADSDGGLCTADKADINAEADTALADYDPPTKAEQDASFTATRGADNDTLKTLSDQMDLLPTGTPKTYDIDTSHEKNVVGSTTSFMLRLKHYDAGVLADATSVYLSDETGAYGVKNTTTAAVIVADGTAVPKVSTGIYEYDASGVMASGTNYTVAFEVTSAGHVIHLLQTITGATETDDVQSPGWQEVFD